MGRLGRIDLFDAQPYQVLSTSRVRSSFLLSIFFGLADVDLTLSDTGVICTLDNPVYLMHVKGCTMHCLDWSARLRTIMIDPTEYRCKLALLRNNHEEMLHIIRTSNLIGQGIIAYLQQKGFPEISLSFFLLPSQKKPAWSIEQVADVCCVGWIALHFMDDKKTRFDLAIECGNLDVALETATARVLEQARAAGALTGQPQGASTSFPFIH